jgi:hypothetical protein
MILQMFGQVNQPGGGGGGGGAELGGLMCFCVGYAIALAAAVLVAIFFLLTLSRALRECSPRNRTMEPGQVWLNLIPLFSVVWMILTILRISESLANEFRSRRLPTDDPDFGKTMGIMYYVTSLVCPGVNVIFWIIYWMKIANYTKQLREDRGGGRGDRVDDDYDDRPRRRRDRDDDGHDDDR